MKQTSSDVELIKRRELSGGKAATINMEVMGIQTSRRKKRKKKQKEKILLCEKACLILTHVIKVNNRR